MTFRLENELSFVVPAIEAHSMWVDSKVVGILAVARFAWHETSREIIPCVTSEEKVA